MGEYFEPTLRKCLLGTLDSIIHQRPISPSTEENCAVAEREAEQILHDQGGKPPKKQQSFVANPSDRKDLLKARARAAHEFFRSYHDYSKQIRKHRGN